MTTPSDAALGIAWLGMRLGRDPARAARLAGGAEALWRAPSGRVARLVGLDGDPGRVARARSAFRSTAVRGELDAMGVHVIATTGAGAPRGLGDLDDPPPVLFARGALAPVLDALARRPVVAVVGARRAGSAALAFTRALSGALAGGGVDALLGGASLALGAGIGALLGGAGAWFGGSELAKVKVLGETLGGKVLQVGPVKAANFPWVLLGRAWLHHQLVAERNHAYRAEISLAVQAEENLMDALPDALAKELGRSFARLRSRADSPEFVKALTEQIDQVLSQSLTEPSPSD